MPDPYLIGSEGRWTTACHAVAPRPAKLYAKLERGGEWPVPHSFSEGGNQNYEHAKENCMFTPPLNTLLF